MDNAIVTLRGDSSGGSRELDRFCLLEGQVRGGDAFRFDTDYSHNVVRNTRGLGGLLDLLGDLVDLFISNSWLDVNEEDFEGLVGLGRNCLS